MNTNAQLVQQLLDSGALQSPVVFDGVIMVKGGAAQPQEPAPPPPSYDPFLGWAFNNASKIGGVMSRGVEELRATLLAVGRKEAALLLPKYHVVRFWQPAETSPSLAQRDPTRYALPAPELAHGLSEEQLLRCIANLNALENQIYVVVGMAGSLERFVRDGYRGQDGRSGFAPVSRTTGEVDFSPAEPPAYKPTAIQAAFPGILQEAQFCNVQREPWTVSFQGPPLRDHHIYDLWFNVQTDEDIARYWRNWAASLGALE